MFDLIAVLLALGLLMYLAFRGISLLILAPVMAMLAVALTSGLPTLVPIAAYTQVFMTSTGNFIVSFFPLFLLGAIFGKLMDDSGAARAIAGAVIAKLGGDRAILSVVLCCAVLTYGGVSLFVVAFAIFPIAAALFRTARIPKRLIPGTLALGSFTFTMSALPGTPAIQNAIPMPFFGTTAFAAPILGLITAAIMLVLGMLWLNRRNAKAQAAGEGYGVHSDAITEPDPDRREVASLEGFDTEELDATAPNSPDLPPFWLAIAPVVLVIVVNFTVVTFLLPSLDTSWLELDTFGPTTLEAVRGVWSIIIALTMSVLFLILTNLRRLKTLKDSVGSGAEASVLPIFNTASLVGFGAVIAALPVFGVISDALLGVGGGNPLISLAIAVNVLSAITGSASGGMSIALDTLGATYVQIARDTGTSLEAMHRVTAVASGALDALPHNGAVITVLGICRLTHRDAYFDIFMVAVLFPMIALVALIALATAFGGI